MSCNGCRVLKQRCDEPCMLKQSLHWIHEGSQGHATHFVAKYYGRACLMSRISAMPDHKRPSAGRTINPGGGAVELLWTGNWHACQSAVEVVRQGDTLKPLPRAVDRILVRSQGNSSESRAECGNPHPSDQTSRIAISRTVQNPLEDDNDSAEMGLDLNLLSTMIEKLVATGSKRGRYFWVETARTENSQEK